MKEVYCAIDLGATSGRIIVVPADSLVHADNPMTDKNVSMEEIYRFPNQIYERDGKYFWDTDRLLQHITEGLHRLAARRDVRVKSIGVDSWGVDVVFMDAAGMPLAHPRAYRDPYTADKLEAFWQHMPRERVYQKTGIQMLPFNTLYQLYACTVEQYEPLRKADKILFISDYIAYCLTERMVCEYTILSTSQMLNPVTKQLDDDLLHAAGVSASLFAPMVYPGEKVGMLKADVSVFDYDVPVIAVAGHDTASAVATVLRGHVAYLSSGTWSLMGVVVDKPVITQDSYRLNFTNEGGIDGTTRLLKNITGMWIIEQCRRQWHEQGKDYDFDQLTAMSEQVDTAETHPELFNPDEARFANPESMLHEVTRGKAMTDAEVVWRIYHSLAHRYGEVFRMLQQLTPWKIEQLVIIGGGARNAYLNRLTEQAVGVPVSTGSTEATALGNVLVQHQIER